MVGKAVREIRGGSRELRDGVCEVLTLRVAEEVVCSELVAEYVGAPRSGGLGRRWRGHCDCGFGWEVEGVLRG